MEEADMDKVEQRQVWAERVAAYQESGLSMKDWCEKTGYSLDQFKYWKYKGKPAGSESWLPVAVLGEPSAAEERVPSEPSLAMHIEIGSARIDVYPGADPQLLREVMRALGETTPC
jgi:hypothetical protein